VSNKLASWVVALLWDLSRNSENGGWTTHRVGAKDLESAAKAVEKLIWEVEALKVTEKDHLQAIKEAEQEIKKLEKKLDRVRKASEGPTGR